MLGGRGNGEHASGACGARDGLGGSGPDRADLRAGRAGRAVTDRRPRERDRAGGVACGTARLTASLGPAEGTAGSVVRTLVLTNDGAGTCVLQGFPGVSYVTGDDGRQVGPAATEDGARGDAVEVPSRGTATARLRLVDVGVFDAATCRPMPVRGLRVYPPGSTTALFVPLEGRGCDADPGRAQLTVSTFGRP